MKSSKVADSKVYIIGSKGIPANYGGFETFIDKLVSGKQSDIQYIITGMGPENKEFTYNDALCVQFKTGKSALSRMLHTWNALKYVYRDAKASQNQKALYILGCRAGIFLPFFRPFLKKHNITILVNPDGAEWKRAKWNFIAKQIVKIHELLLVKAADTVVCDAKAILELIHTDFKVPREKLTFIAYGSEIYNAPATLKPSLKQDYDHWLKKHALNKDPYYLMVGRFVPENNYELVIKEFMLSTTKAHLVIISNVENSPFYQNLLSSTGMEHDKRIKFVGTVYDQDLLTVIRSQAKAYIHGHEVGGTNPSLLEALGSTNITLAYDVSFNREVAVSAAQYFSDHHGNLAGLLQATDTLSQAQAATLGKHAKERIKKYYNWPKIIKEYETLFKQSNRK